MKTLQWPIAWLVPLLLITSVLASNDLVARFAGQQAVDGKNSLAVTFSEDLDATQDLGTYLSLLTEDGTAVQGAWILSEDPGIIYFTNIESDTEYVISIHKGLKAASGKILSQPQEFTIKTREVVPMISFGSSGFILPSRLNRGLPVNTLNINAADIDFFRVKPGFVSEFSRHFDSSSDMYYYMNKQLHTVADLVYSGRWDFEIKKDLRTEVNIPITHIRELAEPGIYFAVLKGAGHYNYGFSSTWFSISDLGLHVRHYKNRLQFHAQSLESASPIKGAAIDGYSKKGETLFTTTTDKDGVASINTDTEKIEYILARSGKSVTFLPMNTPVLDLSEFRMAVEPFRPIDLFVYGPRDLYRPGESVVIDGLLRNHDGRMTAALPLSANIIQPDGRVVHEFLWKGKDYNHYNYEYRLPADAITGKWRITFRHGADRLKEYQFVVADFMPERMKLTVSNPKGQADVLSASHNPAVAVRAEYLYGAPAANIPSDAIVRIRPARQLFKEQWPGYEFGDATSDDRYSFATDTITLDKKGQGLISIENEWQDTRSPLWLTANTSIYDSGGRPVVRNKSWQVWPADQLVGIRLVAKDGSVQSDSTAEFDIIVTNRQGERIKTDGLKAVVIKEHREYYWEYRHEEWQWEHTSHFYPVDTFSLDVPADGAARVTVPVEWGGYRLEITHPDTGLVSSFTFRAGWQPDGGPSDDSGNRPDRVVLTLDKSGYLPGDTARVTIAAPQAGSGYLFVESDTNVLTIPVTVPEEGKTVSFDILPTWTRHDLYVSAFIVRKGDAKNNLLPKRAVGLIRLPLDRSGRKLLVESDLPEKIEPDQQIPVNIQVSQDDGTMVKNAFVTLALVDVGILNLTDFKTPSPHTYFFQGRKYNVQMHDIYQKLIEANKGAWASQRFGGDMAALSRGGDKPSTDVQIISITKQAIKTDNTGKASFSVKIPKFNGRLRAMAVAHTGYTYGSTDKEITIASPLVTQITMPRFLSMGDKARIAVDVHNLTDTSQNLKTNLDIDGPIRITGHDTYPLALEPGQKSTLLFDVFAGQQMGRSEIKFMADGLLVNGKAKQVQQSWYLDTRPAYPAWTKVVRTRLEPGKSISFSQQEMSHLIKETVAFQTVLSNVPPINIAEHVQQLNAYPYGCLEQTTSGIFPFVILGAADLAELGITSQSDDDIDKKIALGIQRLVEKQKTSGGFGLWSSKARESYWLTAYAADFLTHARQAGVAVPPIAYKKALERLKTYIRRAGTIRPSPYTDTKHYRAASRAYAAFVLSRVQGISLGDARALYRSISTDLKGGLGMVHLGLALYLCGDQDLADKALYNALNRARTDHERERVYFGDYGSDIRDLSAAYFLVSTFYPRFKETPQFLLSLQERLNERQWLSTQERNALVLAGSIAQKSRGALWEALISIKDTRQDISGDGSKQFTRVKGEAADGVTVKNTGKTDLYLCATLAGYPEQPPAAQSNGIIISRSYLTPDGKPMDIKTLKSADRMIVQLSFTAEKQLPNALLVDLLPACLELEDPNLAGSLNIDDVKVAGKSISRWHKAVVVRHTEYRDDRFVAALHIPGKRTLRYFYPVRVVSPGDFLVPPPLAEDMYQPSIRAIGTAAPDIQLMQVIQP